LPLVAKSSKPKRERWETGAASAVMGGMVWIWLEMPPGPAGHATHGATGSTTAASRAPRWAVVIYAALTSYHPT